ncbi:bifunctional diguanylate cyclase/phosphodiesterase [Novosphingobium sp. ERN07]|uniref:bifunctional diguanylate cyclase/phosphodiesterase n=1 Tax=Novosphingobium sp. ERN07 TaxID=2726187 RepID=UPI001456544E|nr:bifunctional diguanylate cyclase/phosphodiesterase [Novosphingobium sp. ERN07]NLR70706.1 bifunctional diguanylate cyclase/phosphodiesterase [Novosphingobium sp. ERN07]
MGKGPVASAGKRHDTGAANVGWIVVATFLALLALTAALVAAFRNSTDIADRFARAEERRLAHRFVERSERQILEAAKLQLVWDDAVVRLNAPGAESWARNFIAGYFWGSHRIDRIYHVRYAGNLVRCWQGPKLTGDCRYDQIERTVRDLITTSMRTTSPGGKVKEWRKHGEVMWPYDSKGLPISQGASALISFGGQPTIIAVAPVLPDVTPSLLKGAPDYLVVVRFLDQHILADLQSSLLLDDVRFGHVPDTASARNDLALTDMRGGTVGWLSWRSKPPGPAILRQTAPLLAIYILFFVGVVAGGAIIVRRMRRTTSELMASEAQAQHNAMHDAMSGLPNRAHFMQRLRQELATCVARRELGDVFVAYVDIDRFKVVNDTLGHHVGDELVRQVALRLRRSLPAGDFLSRFGGDEFVLMRRSTGGRASADMLGRQIMAIAREPFVISGHSLEVSLSCGISWGPEQSEDPGELLRRADIALYRAKQRGRARYRRFTRDMDASVKLRREMEMELRRAIARDELTLAYQPIVNAADGAIEGFEALLRWPHPERGPIRPGLFVPVAEQAGLMIPLGEWVLRRVFTECQDWQGCDVSVNLSPLQIMASNFLQMIDDLLRETGADPRHYVLEVTEGVMLDRSEHVVEVLKGLKYRGFRIALDDFGIGYSSLSYLRSFQFDRIKIDRSFVQNIEADLDAHSILRAIVSLGHTLRMKVVAEGVETPMQRALVQAAGCQMIQGHLFWQAMPASEARSLLKPDVNAQASGISRVANG